MNKIDMDGDGNKDAQMIMIAALRLKWMAFHLPILEMKIPYRKLFGFSLTTKLIYEKSFTELAETAKGLGCIFSDNNILMHIRWIVIA